MTYSNTVIFDDEVIGGQLYVSLSFIGSRFLLLDTIDLPDTEAYELGMSLNVIVPVIGRTVIKNYPILSESVIGVGDTFYLIPIPAELSDSQYAMQLVIGLSPDVNSVALRIYSFNSEVTLDTISEDLSILLDRVTTLIDNQVIDITLGTANTFNSIQNNIAFGILSTSLAPITGGVSATALPPLSIGTSVLSPLLLPGV